VDRTQQSLKPNHAQQTMKIHASRMGPGNAGRQNQVVSGDRRVLMSKMPPVPSENQSPKGPGSSPDPIVDTRKKSRPENLAEQDRQGNIKQNTTNQGYQQDR
jgi:hypothetical protein